MVEFATEVRRGPNSTYSSPSNDRNINCGPANVQRSPNFLCCRQWDFVVVLTAGQTLAVCELGWTPWTLIGEEPIRPTKLLRCEQTQSPPLPPHCSCRCSRPIPTHWETQTSPTTLTSVNQPAARTFLWKISSVYVFLFSYKCDANKINVNDVGVVEAPFC